ncbi:hypothetical protein [uncultured Akkermansia sp.]|uniref:hypothetical protein n=1 Tax=uncultured Akkermansia sp. TaxID=512294 RepID=UPI00258907AB|nr:hypothetical protein [uncultured Akkermansia sp.]
MSRKSNLTVIEEIKSLKPCMKEGFTLETRFDQVWTILEDYDLTEVILSNRKYTLLHLRIIHKNIDKENNILANAALQIIRLFANKEGGTE